MQACSYPRPYNSNCVEQVALSLNNLAALLRKMSKGEQAEKLYMRSLSIREEALGPDHPQVSPLLPACLHDVRLLNGFSAQGLIALDLQSVLPVSMHLVSQLTLPALAHSLESTKPNALSCPCLLPQHCVSHLLSC